MSVNSNVSIESSYNQDNLFSIDNQIAITKLLSKSLSNDKIQLLPSNIGIEDREINSLILEYNFKVLERKLSQSAGANNPSVRQLENILDESKYNIKLTLSNYLNQLESTKRSLLASSTNSISWF